MKGVPISTFSDPIQMKNSAISTRIAPFVCTEENSYLLTGQRLTNGAGTADVYSSPMSLRLRSAEMIIFFGKF